ncbi:MAG: hypothetical protein K6F63_09120 [Lachnospiraceae bacterium]|nr:hypothetical protein [Lachnospiraceae bacterium]
MLSNLMAFRNAARQAFQKYQFIIELVFKFIISFAAYDRIVASLNYSETLSKGLFKLLFGAAGAILPPMITILLCICIAVYEVFKANVIMAVLVFAILIVLYCFAARFSGKFAYALVAIPLLVRFNLHYIVPLLLGMTATPMAIFPAAVGVIVYYVFGAVNNSITGDKIGSLDDVLALYTKFISDIFANKEMFFVAGIFAVVIIIMWAMRKIRFDYSFEITIAMGGVLMILGHVAAGSLAGLSISFGNVVLGSLLSILLVYIGQFFRTILDYSGVETVQFEDDDYYYYVKAVPKLDKVILGEVVVSDEAKADRENRKAGAKKVIKQTAIGAVVEQSEKEAATVRAAEQKDEGDSEEDEQLIREGEALNLNDPQMSVYKAVFSGLGKRKKQANDKPDDEKEE